MHARRGAHDVVDAEARGRGVALDRIGWGEVAMARR
jgi:hypothetical protein